MNRRHDLLTLELLIPVPEAILRRQEALVS